MLHYCKKCGRILQNSWGDENYKCDCCKAITFPVPEKYWLNGLDFLINGEMQNLLIEELVKTSPEFDQYLFDHRDEILAKQSADFNAKMAHGKAILEEQSRVPKCPTCGSSNLSKITTTKKVAKISVFGIFGMGDNGKTWKCNSCGSKF